MLSDAFERMPHRGRMRLIAEIAAADADGIECRAAEHGAPDYPLRVDGVLHAAALVELGAQAAAAHTSLHGGMGAHAGLVLALSRVAVARDRVEGGGCLTVSARRLHAMEDAAAYSFEVTDGTAPLVTGEVLLSLQRRAS